MMLVAGWLHRVTRSVVHGRRSRAAVLLSAIAGMAGCSEPTRATETRAGRPLLAWRITDTNTTRLETFTEPAVTERAFYRTFGLELLAHDRESGGLRWRIRTLPAGLSASRLLADASSVIFAGERVIAYEAASGQQRWSFGGIGSTGNCSPWLDDRDLFVCTLRWDVAALDPRSGTLRWHVSLAPWVRGRPSLYSVVASGDTVYASTLEEFGGADFRRIGRVIALDRATGRFLWQFVDGDYTDFRGFNGRPTVAGRLLLYKDAAMDWLTAIDRFEPRVVWRMRPEPGWAGSPHDVTVADGVAYVGAGDRHAYAVDVATGRVLWKSPYLQGSQTWAAPCGRFVLSWTGVTTRILDRRSGAYLGDLESAMESFTDQPYVDGTDLFVGRAGEVRRYRCGP